jgi:hypothetical protein
VNQVLKNEEDDNDVEEYGAKDVTSLEDILWPQECLLNVHTYTKTVHQIERKRKRRKLNANSLLQSGITGSLDSHEALQGHGLQDAGLQAPTAS